MIAHPDGSNRSFFANQAGKFWLATIPEQGMSEMLGLDESSPFMDLTDEVYFDNSYGLRGRACHPNFASFTWDKVMSTGCSGR